MTKPGRAPTKSKGFRCKFCWVATMWVSIYEADEPAGSHRANVQARALGWKISDQGDAYVCPACREVKV